MGEKMFNRDPKIYKINISKIIKNLSKNRSIPKFIFTLITIFTYSQNLSSQAPAPIPNMVRPPTAPVMPTAAHPIEPARPGMPTGMPATARPMEPARPGMPAAVNPALMRPVGSVTPGETITPVETENGVQEKIIKEASGQEFIETLTPVENKSKEEEKIVKEPNGEEALETIHTIEGEVPEHHEGGGEESSEEDHENGEHGESHKNEYDIGSFKPLPTPAAGVERICIDAKEILSVLKETQSGDDIISEPVDVANATDVVREQEELSELENDEDADEDLGFDL